MTQVSIGELIEHEIGGGWGQEEPTDLETEPAAVIRGTDLPRVALGETDGVPRRFHRPSALTKRLLRANDIVFEVSGGSKDQPVGRSMLVSDRTLRSLDVRVICASFCKLLRIDPERADPRFVSLVLQLAYSGGDLGTYCVQSTGITNFKWKPFLSGYLVDLPLQDTQARVAEVFEAIDELIVNNRRRIALLEDMALAIYREWFVSFRYPGHERHALVESRIGSIPAGWDIQPVSGVLDINPSITAPAHSEVPFVAMADLDEGLMLVQPGSSREFAGGGSKFRRHDTLFARITPSVENGKTGFVQFLDDGDVARGSTELLVFRGRSVSPYSTYLLARRDDLRLHAVGSMSGASGRQRVNNACFDTFEIAVPPPALDQQFADSIAPAFGLVEVLSRTNSRLTRLRELLLPKLVTGKVDISNLDVGSFRADPA